MAKDTSNVGRRSDFNLNIRIDGELRRKLMQWGIDHNLPHSHLVRMLLRDYFKGEIPIGIAR